MTEVVNNGKGVRLAIAGLFDGIAGQQGDVIAFIPSGKVRVGVIAAEIEGEPVTLLVRKAPDYHPRRNPFLLATLA